MTRVLIRPLLILAADTRPRISLPSAASMNSADPLLAPWSGPYGGVPPFDKVRVTDFKPALIAGMKDELADAERIANNPAAPTFDNTIAALERSGRMLDRVSRIFHIYTSTLNEKDVQAIEEEMAPQLSAHADQIVQNDKLYKRIAAVSWRARPAASVPSSSA